ncbi:MAG: hypothetical protein WCJ25_02365 [Candidatus Moraniibacteriota bacterium]
MLDDYRTFSFRRAVVGAVSRSMIVSIAVSVLSFFVCLFVIITTLSVGALAVFSSVALPHAIASIVDILFFWGALSSIGFFIACVLGAVIFLVSFWAYDRLPSEWRYAYWRSAAWWLSRKYPVLESDAKDIVCCDIGTIRDWVCELSWRGMPGLPGKVWNGIFRWLDKNLFFQRRSGETIARIVMTAKAAHCPY